MGGRLFPMSQERRRSPRLRCYLPVRLYPQGEAKVIHTLTKDLGLGGLRCLSPYPTPVASPLSIEIELGPGYPPVSLRGQTIWFQSIPQSDQFYLGIAFQGTTEKFRQLLSRYFERFSLESPPLKP